MNLSVLFWLRASDLNSKGTAPLMIRITIDGDDVDFSSGLRAEPNLWNPFKKKVTGNSEESKRINLFISRSETKIKDIFDDLGKQERDISPELIKNIFKGNTKQRITLLSAIDDHNSSFEDRVNLIKDVEESTLDKYLNLRKKIVSFLATKKSKDYFINDVDHSFIQDFRNYLLKSGLCQDTVTGYLKRLSKITTNLFKRGQIKQDPFVDTTLIWSDTTAEGLDETGLSAMESLILTDPMQLKVWHRYIVGCYSGMAHSDITAVKRTDLVRNFGSDELWIKVFRTKTGEYCKIPCLPPVKEIIDIYWNDPKCIKQNNLFPKVHLNTVNKTLKVLSAMAGITIKNTSHIARHTAAQMMLEYGVDVEAIAEILGHASSATTKKTYLRRSHKFVASEIKNLTDKKFPQLKIAKEA